MFKKMLLGHKRDTKRALQCNKPRHALPSDIIHEIIQYLIPYHLYPGDDGYSDVPYTFVPHYISKRAALARLALVSRSWYDPTMRALYREITIFVCLKVPFYSLRESLKSHGTLVRTIILDSRIEDLEDQPSLIDRHASDQFSEFKQRAMVLNSILASCSRLSGLESFGWGVFAFAEFGRFDDELEPVLVPSTSMKHFAWTTRGYPHGLHCALQHFSATLQTLIICQWEPSMPIFSGGRPFTPITHIPPLPQLSELRLKQAEDPKLRHVLELLRCTENIGEDGDVTSQLRVLEVERTFYLTPKDFLYMMQKTKAFTNLRTLIITCIATRADQYYLTKTWEWYDFSGLPSAVFESAPRLTELTLLSPLPLSSFSNLPETLRTLRTLIWPDYFGPRSFMRFLEDCPSRNLALIELRHTSQTAVNEWNAEMGDVLHVGRRLGRHIVIPSDIYPEPDFRRPTAIINKKIGC